MNNPNTHSPEESIRRFFLSFEEHLRQIRESIAPDQAASRANILLNQLRLFENAVAEYREPAGAGPSPDGFFNALLQVTNLQDLVAWVKDRQKLVHVESVFFREKDGEWHCLFGTTPYQPISGLTWEHRGLLARLGWEQEAFLSFVYSQPRFITVFKGGTAPFEDLKVNFTLFISRILPLFIDAPLEPHKSKMTPSRSLIAHDSGFLKLLGLIENAAKTDVSILLEGESGTGKEVLADHIHTSSVRTGKPMVAVNCAAIPAGLMESELFGHEKGAFTGAYQRQIGQVEQANGGTLFLDEIGEMELAMQAKLLRFLQLKEFHRVGGKQKISVDVRIVAATNRDLKEQVAAGKFREDLYYRLSVMPFRIPPLRERIADIGPLCRFFFDKYSRQFGFGKTFVDSEVYQALSEYDYPGNVRELENLVQHILVVAQSNQIHRSHLPENLQNPAPKGKPVARQNPSRVYVKKRQLQKCVASRFAVAQVVQAPPEKAPEPVREVQPWEKSVPEDNEALKEMKALIQNYASDLTLDLERRFLDNLLERADGSMPKAAKLADINRTLLYKMLDRTGRSPKSPG